MALDTAQSRRLGSIRPDSSRSVSIRLDSTRFVGVAKTNASIRYRHALSFALLK